MTRPAYVYRLFDQEGALLYVGMAYDPTVRFAFHSRRKWWPDVHETSVEQYPSRKAAAEAEQVAILTERPRYNVTDHPEPIPIEKRDRVAGNGPPYGPPRPPEPGTKWLPIGELEIARALGIKPKTVHMWQQRGVLPPRRWTISDSAAWNWGDIERFAKETGRSVVSDPLTWPESKPL